MVSKNGASGNASGTGKNPIRTATTPPTPAAKEKAVPERVRDLLKWQRGLESWAAAFAPSALELYIFESFSQS